MKRNMAWLTVLVVSMSPFAAVVLGQEPPKRPGEPSKPATPPAPSPQSPAPQRPESDDPKRANAESDADRAAAVKEQLEVALEGYCPVSYHTDGRATPGDAKYSATYGGFVYHMADAEKLGKFKENPEKYMPRIGGLCTVALGGPYGNKFRGDPKVFAVVDGKLYLCSSERAKRSFDQRPEHYIKRAEELYLTPDLRGMCPVSLSRGEPADGQESYRYIYRGVVYHMKGADELEAFKKDPGRFVPQFGGYCTEGIAAGELRESDPLSAIARNGRLYLFASMEARARCMATEKTCIPDADAKWKELKSTVGKAPSSRK